MRSISLFQSVKYSGSVEGRREAGEWGIKEGRGDKTFFGDWRKKIDA